MDSRDTDLTMATRRQGDVLILSLAGELDMATVPKFEEAIERVLGRSPIAVDLRGLAFIDSQGVKALLQAFKAGQDCHSTVLFFRGPDNVQRVLELTGVEELLGWSVPPAEPPEDSS